MLEIYNEILNNKEYLEAAYKINDYHFVTDDEWDWEHSIGHFTRVANYVKSILEYLNADERTIELGMVAGLLHDIGLFHGKKENHAFESSKMFRGFLKNTNITTTEEQIIEDAILDHSNGKNIKSLIGVALVLADKIDINYHRVKDSSVQDIRNKETAKIKDVEVLINDKELIINYKVLSSFNFTLFKEYICKDWDKPFTIPPQIAKYLNREYIFMINGEKVNDENSFK